MINIKDREERNNALKTFFIGGTFIMCLWGGCPYLIHTFLDPSLPKFSFPGLRWLGGIFIALGYSLAVWCVMLFIKEGKGTPLPFAYPKRLVVVGPYKFVRNPMVIGTVLFLLGDAIALESLGIFVYCLSVFFIMHVFVLVEERALAARFGSAYAVYLQKTPRWLPKF